MRMYFTFLNFKHSQSEAATFTRQAHLFVRKNGLSKVGSPEASFKFSEDIRYKVMDLMMKVDLGELIAAKFNKLIEAMLFVVVEAVSHLDIMPKQEENAEINTLEFVKESYQEKKARVEEMLKVLSKTD